MYTYTLPCGVRFHADMLIGAIVAHDVYPQVFLDTETGAVLALPSAESRTEWKKSVGALNLHRYLYLEPFTANERARIAHDFIDNVIAFVFPKEVPSARSALAEGGWEAFEDFIETYMGDMLEGWMTHIDVAAGARVHEILMHAPIDIEAEMRPCGECTMCKLDTAESVPEPTADSALKTDDIMEHVARQLAERRSLGGDVS